MRKTILALLVAGCASQPAPLSSPAPQPAPAAAPVAAAPAARPAAEAPVPARLTPDAEFRATRPAAGPERAFKVPEVKRFKLKNGLKVILAESHKLPLVGIELVVKTGSAANPKGQAGLADLTADMLDEGTKTRSALAIADEVATLGATLSTNAGWDASSVSITSLSENLDQALAVWADVLQHPAFDDKELSRVRDNLLTGLKRRKNSPPALASLTFSRVLYGQDHPYGWPTNGTEDTVKGLAAADLKKFWETYYHPNNAVLVVAGDITEADLKAKVEPVLKEWRAKVVPQKALPKTPALAKAKVFLVDKAGAPQSSIRVGLVGINRKSPDYYKALVMNHILGGSFKRLMMNLREAKGWTYGVSSSFEARRTPGPWTAGGEFVAAHTGQSVEEILKEVKSLRDEEVSDKELQETKDELVKAFPARFSTVNQIAGQMAGLAVYDLPDNELESYT
ncbi:MAG TPA: pitrilysin family protein, partial [Polyangia bacterium]|nr:pitrilysin family protein [Polyangia bacterium]